MMMMMAVVMLINRRETPKLRPLGMCCLLFSYHLLIYQMTLSWLMSLVSCPVHVSCVSRAIQSSFIHHPRSTSHLISSHCALRLLDQRSTSQRSTRKQIIIMDYHRRPYRPNRNRFNEKNRETEFGGHEKMRFCRILISNAEQLLVKNKEVEFINRVICKVLRLTSEKDIPSFYWGPINQVPIRYESPREFAQIAEILLLEQSREKILAKYTSITDGASKEHYKFMPIQFKVFNRAGMLSYNANTRMMMTTVVAFVSARKTLSFTSRQLDYDLPGKEMVVLLSRPSLCVEQADFRQVAVVVSTFVDPKWYSRVTMERLIHNHKESLYYGAPVLFDESLSVDRRPDDEFVFFEMVLMFPKTDENEDVFKQNDILDVLQLTFLGFTFSKLKVLKRLPNIVHPDVRGLILNASAEVFCSSVTGNAPRHFDKIINILKKYTGAMNDDQLEVLKHFGTNLQDGLTNLSTKCLLIKGSPGSGKTHTMALAAVFCLLWYHLEHSENKPMRFCEHKVLFTTPNLHSATEFFCKLQSLGLLDLLVKFNREHSGLDNRVNHPALLVIRPDKVEPSLRRRTLAGLTQDLAYKGPVHGLPPNTKPSAFRTEVLTNANLYISTLDMICHDQHFLKFMSEDFPRCRFPEFRATFVDDCSKAPLFDLVQGMTVKTRQVVLGGDVQEMNAFNIGEMNRRLNWNRNVYNLLDQLFRPQKFGLQLVRQYRMKPSIAHFSTQYFYNGKVINMTEGAETRNCPLRSLLHFNIPSSIEEQVTKTNRFYFSFRNMIEVKFTVYLMDVCLSALGFYNAQTKQLNTELMEQSDFSLGIIAYYAAQRNKIFKELCNYYPSWRRALETKRLIIIETADSMLGKEYTGTIQCFVRSKNDESHEAEGKGVGFMSDAKRVHVGLTRGKHFNFIISNVDRFDNADKFSNNFFKYLHKDSFNRKRLVDIAQILSKGSYLKFDEFRSELMRVVCKRRTSYVTDFNSSNDLVPVKVIHYNNDRDFTVTPVENEEELKEMERFTENPLRPANFLSYKEVYCTRVSVGIFEDIIHRVCILNVNGNMFTCKAIDHGFLMELERKDIFRCPDSIYFKPIFAIPCSLNVNWKAYWKLLKPEVETTSRNAVFLKSEHTSKREKVLVSFDTKYQQIEVLATEELVHLVQSYVGKKFQCLFNFEKLNQFRQAFEEEMATHSELKCFDLADFISVQNSKLIALILNMTDYYKNFTESTVDYVQVNDLVAVCLGNVFVRVIILESAPFISFHERIYKVLAIDLGAVTPVFHNQIRKIASVFDTSIIEPFKPQIPSTLSCTSTTEVAMEP